MTSSRLRALGLTAPLARAAGASPALAKTPKPKPSVSQISFTHYIDKASPVLLGLAPSSPQSRGRYQLRRGVAQGVSHLAASARPAPRRAAVAPTGCGRPRA